MRQAQLIGIIAVAVLSLVSVDALPPPNTSRATTKLTTAKVTTTSTTKTSMTVTSAHTTTSQKTSLSAVVSNLRSSQSRLSGTPSSISHSGPAISSRSSSVASASSMQSSGSSSVLNGLSSSSAPLSSAISASGSGFSLGSVSSGLSSTVTPSASVSAAVGESTPTDTIELILSLLSGLPDPIPVSTSVPPPAITTGLPAASSVAPPRSASSRAALAGRHQRAVPPTFSTDTSFRKRQVFTLYHGTCQSKVTSIRRGPTIPNDRAGDFTYRGAFYLTDSFQNAAAFIIEKGCRPGDGYVVLEFDFEDRGVVVLPLGENTDFAIEFYNSMRRIALQPVLEVMAERYGNPAPPPLSTDLLAYKQSHDSVQVIEGARPITDKTVNFLGRFYKEPFNQILLLDPAVLPHLTYIDCYLIDPIYTGRSITQDNYNPDGNFDIESYIQC